MHNRRDGAGKFPRQKDLAPPGAFVIEQNAVSRAQAVAFPVIYRRPIRKTFGHAVGTAWPERRLLRLRNLLRFAIHLAAGSLIKARANSGLANGFENANAADSGDVRSIFG